MMKDWINEEPQEVLLGWEVHIRGMEKNDKFGKLHAKKQEVATELEHEIFASLVNDLICSFRRNGLVIYTFFFSKSNCIACLRGVSSCIR